MSLLTTQQAGQVAEAIAAVEQQTDAELVTVLARQADDYFYIPTLWAALAALICPGILLFTPFWLSVSDILLAQLGLFVGLAVLLRLPPVLQRIIPRSVKRQRAANLARRSFLDNNLHHTKDGMGVLIFVAETEHYVEILADRGINARVDPAQWQAIVDTFTDHLRRKQTLDGFVQAVNSCGALLTQHAPATAAKNELPNHLIVID